MSAKTDAPVLLNATTAAATATTAAVIVSIVRAAARPPWPLRISRLLSTVTCATPNKG
jgi:hypothetical protein